MKENTIEQVQNIVSSLVRISEKRVSDERIDFACAINHLLAQASKNDWDKNYSYALKDLMKLLKIRGTIYELYRY